MLTKDEAVEKAEDLLQFHRGEMVALDPIYSYWTGTQALPVVPRGVPEEVRRFAQMSRINVIGLVVSVLAQVLYVDGYRENPEESSEDAPGWAIWQANRMDAHQTGVHRAGLAYGTSYVVVLPPYADDVTSTASIRGVSPRSMTAMYDEDSHDWPWFALEIVESPWSDRRYRLYDEDAVYELEEGARDDTMEYVGDWTHGLGVCPVVRFRNVDRLNEPPPPAGRIISPHHSAYTGGEVEHLMGLQDLIDVTTFDLTVAQHFQSFRQRYIMGWSAEEENVRAKATASRLWTFEEPDVRVGEFGQVDLTGYLSSREGSLTLLGVISQTPGHELLGKMTNLSAEALVAAEQGQRRKVIERQNLFGESWEQVLGLASRASGLEEPDHAQVRWRDTEARSLGQTVDALLKLAQMGIPPEGLWEWIPGVTQSDVARWLAMSRETGALGQLQQMLQGQMGRQAAPAGAEQQPQPPTER